MNIFDFFAYNTLKGLGVKYLKMNLRSVKTIGVFVTFILCFLTHFLYTFFPNFLTSLFFPVNESIWEHVKMMVSTILIWEVIEYFLLKNFSINHNNFLFSLFITIIVSIPIFLIIYYPIYKCIGSVFLINIICLFIAIYFSYVIGYQVMNKGDLNLGIFGLVGIILLYIIFGYFTYFPPKNELFLNPVDNSYGISN